MGSSFNMTFTVPSLYSGGVMLTYKCDNACRYCLYCSSPKSSDEVMSEELINHIKGQKNVDKEREAVLLTFSIFGQVFGFRLYREMLVRHLGFTGFSVDEIVELKDLLIRNIFRQLGVTP